MNVALDFLTKLLIGLWTGYWEERRKESGAEREAGREDTEAGSVGGRMHSAIDELCKREGRDPSSHPGSDGSSPTGGSGPGVNLGASS